MNSFMTRAILRESGSERPDFRHQIALREAERAYFETLALLENEEAPARSSRLKTAAKVAAGGAAAYVGGMGGLGAYRTLKHGGTLKQAGLSALAHIRNPRAVMKSFTGSLGSRKKALLAKFIDAQEARRQAYAGMRRDGMSNYSPAAFDQDYYVSQAPGKAPALSKSKGKSGRSSAASWQKAQADLNARKKQGAISTRREEQSLHGRRR